jgi:Zn-finger nucleic acid-binding protein
MVDVGYDNESGFVYIDGSNGTGPYEVVWLDKGEIEKLIKDLNIMLETHFGE